MAHRIPKVELAYAAALIDGEGCIGVRYSYSRGREQFYVGVTLTNTAKCLPQFLKDRWGGGMAFRPSPKADNRKPYYHYIIAARKAAVLLRDVLPYLTLKQRQARLALRCQEYLSAGWGSQGMRRTPARLKKLMQFRDAMHVLNGRGRVRRKPVNRAYEPKQSHEDAPESPRDYHRELMARPLDGSLHPRTRERHAARWANTPEAAPLSKPLP